MHVTLDTVRPADSGQQPVLRRRLADATGRPVRELCLWPDEPSARTAGGEVWEVFAHHLGRAVGQEPVAAQLVSFDGPREAARVAASRRAGTERIWPSVRDLDGLVETFVLERPDGAELVVSFATDAEHFARAGERIMSTTLLPGEDPALLGDPDRVEVLHVLGTSAAVQA